jgi:hypothetical protein
VLINFLAILTDTLVAAVSVATLQASANIFVLGALVKIIAHLLVIRKLETVGTRASVAAFGVVARMAALMTSILTFVDIHTFL